MKVLVFYMEEWDRWKDGRVGLVLVMHELKPVLVFGGRKKIGGKEIAWWRRDRWKGGNERNERTTYVLRH